MPVDDDPALERALPDAELGIDYPMVNDGLMFPRTGTLDLRLNYSQ